MKKDLSIEILTSVNNSALFICKILYQKFFKKCFHNNMEFKIESPAFRNGEEIPIKYTCQGDDISPPLEWKGLPEETEEIAIICDDPDAPLMVWVHWIIYGISPEKNGLPEAVPKKEILEEGEKQGKNSWGRIGYGGPCPPGGKPHRYYFKIYALDKKLDIEQGIKKKRLLREMEGHIIAKAELIGKYARK